MFETEENQSEQSARFLINSIRKSMNKGDLKGASRRLARVRNIAEDRHVEKKTLGELLLVAASVARSCGRNEEATKFIMSILHGNGGMSIETLGRAKRLRARLLLDENKLDEAEVLVGTADRYILTGLVEEKIEHVAGREIRVNVPVEQKFLDNGEHISFETYFLLAEIAILDNNWDKAVWNLNQAFEKYQDSRLFPELEMWRGILQMAKGESFIEVIEPVISQGLASAVLVGRIEALMNENRREDSPLNEAEFNRFCKIGNLARQRPLQNTIIIDDDKTDEISEITEIETVDTESAFNGNLKEFRVSNKSIAVDLTDWSLLSLVELCNIERLTGSIELSWNEAAVSQGISESILHEAVLSGKGFIYCQNGRFVDAELAVEGETNLSGIPSDKKARSEFNLHQILMTAIGGGCWEILNNIQEGKNDPSIMQSELPRILGSIKRSQEIEAREDVLQITSNVNTCLDVAKILDEIKGGVSFEDDEEIDWDADWGTPAAQSKEIKNEEPDQQQVAESSVKIQKPSLPETETPEILSNNAAEVKRAVSPALDLNENNPFDLDDNPFEEPAVTETETLTDGDNFEFQLDETFDSLKNDKSVERNINSANQTQLLPATDEDAPESEFFAPPWEQNDLIEESFPDHQHSKIETEKKQSGLVLISDEISEIVKADSWFKVNENLAQVLSFKLNCGIRISIARENEEFIVSAFGDHAESIAHPSTPIFQIEFKIIEKIKWILKADRPLDQKETAFSENLFEIGKLTLLNLDHSDGKEIRSVGGVTIADDEWLAKFMIPPVSLIMRKKINEAQVYASQDGMTHPKAHILLGGETGTGKDVFARVIHAMSGRRNKDFVRADMGAIGGGDQFIATLFGAVKGAYTGQTGERRGLVEEAEGGTLFLNEIGNLSLESQRALLDFMQEGCYTRLGDTKLRNADVRVILATNENINDAAKFRQDVKFRCAPAITLPPLRDRREDIAALAVSFGGPDIVIREAALKLLEFQNWQGNVRELSQVIKTAVAKIGGTGELKASVIEEVLENLTEGQDITTLSFPVPPAGTSYSEALEAYEKFLLISSLNLTGNKKSKAAQLWGESPASITKKVKKWSIESGD